MERLLSVSRELRDKVEQNEGAAGELLRQCEELREELKAMRQVSQTAVIVWLSTRTVEYQFIGRLCRVKCTCQDVLPIFPTVEGGGAVHGRQSRSDAKYRVQVYQTAPGRER